MLNSNYSSIITFNSDINLGNTMPVLDALYGNVTSDIRAFETQSFVNGHVYGESTGRALDINEMRALKNEILKIVQDFNRVIRNCNLSNEQLQLAKIVYIYNYILANVKYASVLSANDGTARVQNRPEEMLIPYESAYTALVRKQSVCCGISDAIYLLCKVLGLECEKWLWPDGGHAFNKVKIGSYWYKLDATMQMGFYPGAKAEAWNTSYFLTATQQLSNRIYITSRDYSRHQIQIMKVFLENHGVDFSYSTTPKIVINTTLDGLNKLVSNSTLANETTTNLDGLISIVGEVISSPPQITFLNRASGLSESSTILFVPADKKITIQKVNHKINLVRVNSNYAVNIESVNNIQHTVVTDALGIISGRLQRGTEFFADDVSNDLMIKIYNYSSRSSSNHLKIR